MFQKKIWKQVEKSNIQLCFLCFRKKLVEQREGLMNDEREAHLIESS